jgi:hypothetical protein
MHCFVLDTLLCVLCIAFYTLLFDPGASAVRVANAAQTASATCSCLAVLLAPHGEHVSGYL